jgi:hypothetical protein
VILIFLLMKAWDKLNGLPGMMLAGAGIVFFLMA